MNVALTFDVERDIPYLLDSYKGIKEGLTRILSILDKYDIKSTFFWTADAASKFPSIIKLLATKGHEIGSHGMHHERLTNLNYKICYNIIAESKILLENISNSKIYGFRAPYLKIPDFLFSILHDLDFKYDSSIISTDLIEKYNKEGYDIHEYPPLNYNFFFRFSSLNFILSKIIKNRGLTILFFHPWEAIDMKKQIRAKQNRFEIIKNIIFRPDRWKNTGERFVKRFDLFIQECIAKDYEFVILKKTHSK